MKGPWTEKEKECFKHLVSEAWTEEERCYMKGPWTEEERIILKHLVWELGLKRGEVR